MCVWIGITNRNNRSFKIEISKNLGWHLGINALQKTQIVPQTPPSSSGDSVAFSLETMVLSSYLLLISHGQKQTQKSLVYS